MMNQVWRELPNWPDAIRDGLAKVLLGVAERVRPRQAGPPSVSADETHTFKLQQLASLPFGERLDWDEAHEGRFVARYSALDPIWNTRPVHPSNMIPLRQHIQELCSFVARLDQQWDVDADAIFEHLRLAYSLEEVSADTDFNQDSYMCGHAADYEDASSELAAKHLAGTIVFNLVWTAYEGAVEAASGKDLRNLPKGAVGRDLLRDRFGARLLPGLKEALLAAVELHPHDEKSIRSSEVKAALSTGSWVFLAAEHLRRFRNASVHGDIAMPEPEDWGKLSTYVVDQDPAIRRFAVHIRLTLLLIQALTVVAEAGRVTLLPNGMDVVERLTTLHLVKPDDDEPTLFGKEVEDDTFYTVEVFKPSAAKAAEVFSNAR